MQTWASSVCKCCLDDKRQATGEVYFSRSVGVQLSISGSNKILGWWCVEGTWNWRFFPWPHWIEEERWFIGLKWKNPVSCLNEKIEIFVTPSYYLHAKFRGMFARMKLNILQLQNQREGFLGRIWATASTAQLCSMVYSDRLWNILSIKKWLIGFQNRSSCFWCFTHLLHGQKDSVWDGWNSEWIGSSMT